MSSESRKGEGLLPCPFCGGPAAIVKNGFPPRSRWRHPSCVSEVENCPGKVEEQDEQGGTLCDCATDEEAADLWNRRAPRSERRPNFPMMDGPPIPLELAEAIWQGYAALFGKGQKLERVGERGGFGWGEVAAFWSKPKAREAITAALAANRHLAEEKS